MNNKLILIALVLSVVGVGLAGSVKVYAQSSVHPASALVHRLASRFGLQAGDVQAVFDADRSDRRAQMESKYETRLSQYVKEGKITEIQKQLILAKHEEIQKNRLSELEQFKSMNTDERIAARKARITSMDAGRKSLEEWATSNGIDMQYVMGFGMHTDFGSMGKMGSMRGF